MVVVKVEQGYLEGDKVRSIIGDGFFCSFKGIPYAAPPIGELRFKEPKPCPPWAGVRQAKEHGPECCQYDYLFRPSVYNGLEDCLYLNVYTPNIEPPKPLPVMVFIHGGGFMCGSGNDDFYGPDFLVKHDVILVTINYRLEVLGFLCLDTEDIPGNAGMKDQVAALRWVQRNIESFGGDPDNVTIFGQSAGAASVSLHLVSPMSKGLFKRAIMQSGTMICPWVQTYGARDRAILLARQLDCQSNNDKEISDFFKNVPVECLVKKSVPLTLDEYTKISPKIYFGVVSEKKFCDQECFFEGNTTDVLRNGIHEGVEVINGYTEDEGILYFALGCKIERITERIVDQANSFLDYFAPCDMTISLPTIQKIELGKKIKKFYLNDVLASEENIEDLLGYFNMNVFVYGALAFQKVCAKRNKNIIYLYKFSCKSERNVFARMYKCPLSGQRVTVSHCDDLCYLFHVKMLPVVDINSNTYKMIEQVTKLWTNFAKYGDPTPDNSLDAKWEPYTVENQHYLDIGNTLTPGISPNKEELQFWEEIYEEYYPQNVY